MVTRAVLVVRGMRMTWWLAGRQVKMRLATESRPVDRW